MTSLEDDLAGFIALAEAPLGRAIPAKETATDEWPDKKLGDLLRVFVSLEGDSFGKGVSLVIANTIKGVRIWEYQGLPANGLSN